MILLSAFEPFDIDPENSTELTLRSYLATSPEGVQGLVLPVSFARAWPELKRAILDVKPTMVVAMGQADGRTSISLERVALNFIDARLADADGHRPQDQEIDTGPLALMSTLPHRLILEALVARGLPAALSYSAGTYVCNAVMYSLLKWAQESEFMAGFVHFPLLREQRLGRGRENLRPPPTLKLEDSVLALATIVGELKKHSLN